MNAQTLALALGAAVLLGGCARASLPGDGNAPTVRQPENPLDRVLFSAERVMNHQAALRLTPDQRQAIQKAVQDGQARMLELQWEMSAAREQLARSLDVERPDEAAARASAEKVVGLEGQIKLAHLSMLVRVKALLTSEQQSALRALPSL